MPITPLPALDRTSVNFKANVDAFFGSQLPTFSTEAEAARVEINTKQGQAAASAAAAAASEAAVRASKDAAGLSEGAANTARNAAQAAQAAAEIALDSLDDRYLGAKAAAPTSDNDGAALITGAMYWDTVLNGGCLRVWQGAWVTIPANVASAISNTPSGGIAATTVQAAINELDTEKLSIEPISFNGDLSTLKTTGNYVGFTWTNGPIPPTIATFTVIAYSPDWVTQEITIPGAVVTQYSRTFYNGANWGPWLRVYSEGNKPTKDDVGLGSVENTSDSQKPISTAQRSALMDLSGAWLTYGGTANAVALTSPASRPLAVYIDGGQYRFKAAAANTGTSTLAIDGLAAKPILTITGVALPAGYIRTGVETVARYESALASFVVNRLPERGSNANGEYERRADGTQICHRNLTLQTTAVAAGAAATVIPVYAAAFLAGYVEILKATFFTGAGGTGVALYGLAYTYDGLTAVLNTGQKPTEASPGFSVGPNAALSYAYTAIAVGRWF